MQMNKYFELIKKIVSFGETENEEYANLYNSLTEIPARVWSPKEYTKAVNDISSFVEKYITSKILENRINGYSNTNEKEIERSIEHTIDDVENLLKSYREDLETMREAVILERNNDLEEMLEDYVDTMYDDEEFNNEN